MTSAEFLSGQTQTASYSYDADGRRVRRKAGVSAEVWQVYGMDAELLAEYAAASQPSQPQKEYGYRSGELLITAEAVTTGGWGSPPVLSDNPLVVGQTVVRSLHVTELRDAINALRSHLGISAYQWQTAAGVGDWISASPIQEMRAALDEALGAPSGGYGAGLAQGQAIKAVHIQELRNRTLGAWQSGGSAGVEMQWLVTDHLGTPRMVVDQTGTLTGVKRHDYLPFGEEIGAGVGGRTTAQGYSQFDGVRMKFTGKERDNETGLDYFGARYYSNVQGRFTGVDPYNIIFRKDKAKSSQDRRQLLDSYILQPQVWNRYAYALNNPCNNIDVDGRCSVPAGLKPGSVGICIEAFIASRRLPGAGLTKLGRGDNRTFSGTNENLPQRVRVDLIVTPVAGQDRHVIQETTRAGTSKATVPLGPIFDIKMEGTASSTITNATTTNGTATFTVTTTAKNGFPSLPGAPSEPIDFKLNIEVAPGGKVGMPAGGERDGYPSIGVYSYQYVDGKLVTTKIYEDPEGKLKDLAPPMEKKVPEVKPR